MKKTSFFKRNISIFFAIILFTSSMVGLYYLGKSYVNNVKYDFILSINRKTDLNYSRRAGDTTRITLNFQEGIVVNNISDTASTNLINNPSYWGDEELRKKYEKQTENAEIIIIDDIETTNRDINDGDPGTYGTTVINDQAWGIAEKGFVDLNNNMYRFYIRENLYWSTGELLKASDFGYALFNIMNQRQASMAEYMPGKYAMLQGASEWSEYQANIILKGETEDWSKLNNLFYDDVAGDQGINYVTKEIQNQINRGSASFVFNNEEGYIQYQTNGNSAFQTILQNPMFMPINQDWIEQQNKNGTDNFYLTKFGTSEKTLSTYGAFEVIKFDPSYGIILTKNIDYHNADLIASKTMSFRVIEEPTTSLSMFKNETLQAFVADEIQDKTILFKDEYSNEWMDWQLGRPTFSSALFNLDADNQRSSAKYYKNPNFRKAIYYAMDRAEYLKLASIERGVPSSLLVPTNFGQFGSLGNEQTIVDWAYDTKLYKNTEQEAYLGNYNEKARQEILLTEQSAMDGVPYERGKTEATNWTDPKKDVNLANYYYDKFLEDMSNIGISVPSKITLEYITSKGDSDTLVQALRTSLENANLPIEIKIDTILPGTEIAKFIAGDFDLFSLSWNPDIGDPWGVLSVYNEVDRNKGFNMSASWNYWTGSEETYGNTYTNQQKDDIDLYWEKDGILSTSVQDMIDIVNFPDSITSTITGQEGKKINDIYNFLNNEIAWDDDLTKPNAKLKVNKGNYNPELDYWQVTGPSQEDVFKLTSEEKAILYLFLEASNMNSTPTINVRNQIPQSAPNKSPFSSVPSLGYSIYIYSYNPKIFAKMGFPNEEAILNSRHI